MLVSGGAEVITTVSNEEKAAYARASGADHTVNYRDADAAEQILDLTGGGTHRAIELEFGVNVNLLIEVMRQNGTIAAYGSAQSFTPEIPFIQMMFKNLTLRTILVYILTAQARAETLTGLNKMLADGSLSHAIGATFPLDDTAKAHELVKSADKSGTVVVEI